MKSLELENDSVAPDTPSHALGGLPVLHDFTRNHDTAFTAEERRRVEFEGFLRHAVRRLAVLAHVYLELRQPVDVAFAAARADLESDFAKPSRIRDLSRRWQDAAIDLSPKCTKMFREKNPRQRSFPNPPRILGHSSKATLNRIYLNPTAA